jgi:hypothetical protein
VRSAVASCANGTSAGIKGRPLPGRLREHFPRIHITDLRSMAQGSLRFYLGSREAVLTVLAKPYEVGDDMPILHQERERQRRRLAWRVAGAVVLTGVLATLSGASWRTRNPAAPPEILLWYL